MSGCRETSSGLTRELGFFSATILVVANMIGTGIFTTSGLIIRDLGRPIPLLLCWLVGGVFALCGALCYGELGALFPEAGGEYVYLREAFGRLPAFLSGWISLIVGFSAPIAASAIAFSVYFSRAFSIPMDTLLTLKLFGRDVLCVSTDGLMAILAVVVLSLVHSHSIRVGSRVQIGLTMLKISVIVAFIAGGFLIGRGSSSHFSGGFGVASLFDGSFATSLIFISFAYSGWNAAAYLGGEIKEPGSNIPLSLLTGTVVVIICYLALNAVYVYALPAREMSGVIEVGEKAAASLFGNDVGRLLTGAIALGILSALSAMILTGPRVYYAMSQDGVFFRIFGRLHRKRGTPAFSIVLQAAIAILMILTSSFEKLLLYTGFTLSLFAILTVVGLIRLRLTRRARTTFCRTFGYPVTPLVFVVGSGLVVCLMIAHKPAIGFWGVLTICLGALFYYCLRWKERTGKTGIEGGPAARRD